MNPGTSSADVVRGRPLGVEKAPSGIAGLDEVLHGGLPRGRPTLVCGGPGSGKTMLGLAFLVNGVRDHGENGVLLAFEETKPDLVSNAASWGLDLDALVAEGKLVVEHIEVDPIGLRETGDFDLGALFIRIQHAVNKVGARRIVLDTLENLFAALPDADILRTEVHRLFAWLKSAGLTAVVTAEAGERTLTRAGIEEYVSDCVLALEQNVVNQVSTRRLRVLKYRGSGHGTNLYPFLIDDQGITVAPITGASLRRSAPLDRISTGVAGLDLMLGGEGPYRGSTILVSGTAGTGKTTLGTHFADAACSRGERCLFYSFEQSADVILRDTGRLGERLRAWIDAGLLRFHTSRPTSSGLDVHLTEMRRAMREYEPSLVILDPISGFGPVGEAWEMKNMLMLLMDTVAESGTTLVMTSLTSGDHDHNATEIGVSSLADVWILLRDLNWGTTRRHGMYVLKARGTAHESQVHCFTIDENGIQVTQPLPDDVAAGGDPGPERRPHQ